MNAGISSTRVTAAPAMAAADAAGPGRPRADSEFRSGFVAVVGPPNAGKSTLTNALVGSKIAITTAVPQTTRTVLRGIVHRPDAQIVVVDTPGVHPPRDALGEEMVRAARRALGDADVAVLVLDASRAPGAESRMAAEAARRAGAPVVVTLNKCDQAGADGVAAWERWLGEYLGAPEVIRTSARRAEGLQALVDAIVRRLPAGPPYFEGEDLTDRPVRTIVGEIIREKAMALTREEVPHAIAVEVEEIAPRPERDLVYIRATLHVERPSQKKILVGGGGRMIRAIGRRSREDVERLIGVRAYLDLWVTVSENWRDRPALVRRFYPEL